jgi:hypothetical protein
MHFLKKNCRNYTDFVKWSDTASVQLPRIRPGQTVSNPTGSGSTKLSKRQNNVVLWYDKQNSKQYVAQAVLFPRKDCRSRMGTGLHLISHWRPS